MRIRVAIEKLSGRLPHFLKDYKKLIKKLFTFPFGCYIIYTSNEERNKLFRISSAVEQLTVNQLVGGSIPPSGANFRIDSQGCTQCGYAGVSINVLARHRD